MTGIPGMRGVEHVGFSVPDIEQAITFFVDVVGCEYVYDMGPFEDPEGTWMSDNLNIHRSATIARIAFLRCANGANFELFQFSAPDQVMDWPKMSDFGGHHIAFQVHDMDAAIEYLHSRGVTVLGGKKAGDGPAEEQGSFYAHFLTPWGQLLELVSYPSSRARSSTGHPLWTVPATNS
ncbi:VOC family protein [Paenarthrobacter nicotinovorans]|uniref:VOC family protein n=1 Tax=Paenarthrobacter nicotinovorans TaxID=29320 RepID=UPI00381C7B96